MKKNILLLINGFGIERTDSYNVYSKELMPNMDRITTERLFVSIPNNYLDYKSAYRNFSIGTSMSLTYNLIENNISNLEYKKNELLRYITNETIKHNSRLHIICYYENEKTLEHLTTYIKEIHNQTSCKIFLHIILCQKSLTAYKDISRSFTSINYDMGNNIKIGVITGENNLYDNSAIKDIIKLFMTEFGEKWRDLTKKAEVLEQNKTNPCDTRSFGVNADFKFEENDQVLIFNYNNIDISLLMKELYLQRFRQINLDNVAFYSLFPVKAEKKIPFMYNFVVASNYALSSLKSINANCIVFDKRENCPYINYYMTGLRNTIDDDLKYVPTDDGFIYDSTKLMDNIKNYDKYLTIINYDISSCKTLEEMRDRLSKIDSVIGVLYDYCKDNNYGLFITSLYGIETEIYNQKQELCRIDFYGRSPLVICDNSINTTNYSVTEGSLFDLSNTIFWNINNSYKTPGILKKKSSLLSFLYKKPKEVKNNEKTDK